MLPIQMVVGTCMWLQGAGLTCGHPPRAEPSGVEDFGHTQRHKEPGQTLRFGMFQREAFVPLDCTQKIHHFRHLGCEISPWHAPAMLDGSTKAPSKPPPGPPQS